MHSSELVALSGIGLIGIGCQWLAWRLKVPAILFLLLAGIIAGPVSGWLNPQLLFGDLLYPMISLAVAVILFEGSLTLKFNEIQGLEKVVRNMITVGLLITWVVTAFATRWLTGFSWELAFLFGALVVVTGPTVIIPMMRTVRPNAKIASVLRWEGIVIDPIGALLAVLAFEFIISSSRGEATLGEGLWIFGSIVLTGFLGGAFAGYALGIVLRHFWIPEFLHNLAALSLVLATFTVSDMLSEESGLLAVTVMGIWLANMKNVHTEDILNFKESLSMLFISGLFIILAAQLQFEQFAVLGWSGLGVLVAIQFVARPLKVLVSTTGSSLNWRERALIAWMAPRGIVAASVSALFAIRLQQNGFSQAELIVPLTFSIIIGTVVLQSVTARPLANWLKVAETETTGLLIIGANPVARVIAATLSERGFKTLLTDSSWDNIRAARMAGLMTYYGNPVSEHADRHLDLVGLGRLLALSSQPELNALASVRYRTEFGRNAVYSLPVTKGKDPKREVASEHRGYILFSDDASYAKLASLVSQGANLRTTKLSDDFSFEDFRTKHGKRAIPLFAISPKNRLEVFIAGGKLQPAADWSIISLIQEEEDKHEKPLNEMSATANPKANTRERYAKLTTTASSE